ASSVSSSLLRPPPLPTPFPYTTLFRSSSPGNGSSAGRRRHISSAKAQRSENTHPCGGRRMSGTRPGIEARSEPGAARSGRPSSRSEEHTSELQSRENLVCRLLLEKKKK